MGRDTGAAQTGCIRYVCRIGIRSSVGRGLGRDGHALTVIGLILVIRVEHHLLAGPIVRT